MPSTVSLFSGLHAVTAFGLEDGTLAPRKITTLNNLTPVTSPPSGASRPLSSSYWSDSHVARPYLHNNVTVFFFFCVPLLSPPFSLLSVFPSLHPTQICHPLTIIILLEASEALYQNKSCRVIKWNARTACPLPTLPSV